MSSGYRTRLPVTTPPFYIPVQVAQLHDLFLDDEITIPRPASILILVWSGNGCVELEQVQQKLSAGSVVACSAADSLRFLSQQELHGIWIEYSSLTPGKPEFSLLNGCSPLAHCPDRIIALGGELLEAWTEPDERKPFAVQHLFTTLLMELYSEMVEKAQPASRWLDRVLQYIDNHYNEDLTRGQMAALANVSPEHFSRSFRKAAGQTFNEYVTLLRIRKAQQRLLTGAPNLSALALEVGYGEGTYLSRKFKQVVGLSPTAYLLKPKRVVALNYNHTASLRALEVLPHLGFYSEWQEHVDNVPSVHKLQPHGNNSATLYDSVASARPDVIISYSSAEENKSLLSVAPLIELPFMQMSWREQFCRIADVVDRRRHADQWLAHYDQLCATANQRLDQRIGTARGTAIVWEIGLSSAYCFHSSFGRGCQLLYGELGFHPPAAIVDKGIMNSGYLELAIEDIPSLPADYIFITDISSQPVQTKEVHRLFHSDSWIALDAVRNKQVYLLNQPEMFYGFDPLSSQAQLQVLLEALTS